MCLLVSDVVELASELGGVNQLEESFLLGYLMGMFPSNAGAEALVITSVQTLLQDMKRRWMYANENMPTFTLQNRDWLRSDFCLPRPVCLKGKATLIATSSDNPERAAKCQNKHVTDNVGGANQTASTSAHEAASTELSSMTGTSLHETNDCVATQSECPAARESSSDGFSQRSGSKVDELKAPQTKSVVPVLADAESHSSAPSSKIGNEATPPEGKPAFSSTESNSASGPDETEVGGTDEEVETEAGCKMPRAKVTVVIEQRDVADAEVGEEAPGLNVHHPEQSDVSSHKSNLKLASIFDVPAIDQTGGTTAVISSEASSDSVSNTMDESQEYVSVDAKEIADNDSAEWQVLRHLLTDSDRYKFVRKRWRNVQIPDPHCNLTHFGHRQRLVTQRLAELGLHRKRTRGRKRALSCDDRTLVANKRRRLVAGCTFVLDWLLAQGRSILTAGRIVPRLAQRHKQLNSEADAYGRRLMCDVSLTPPQRRQLMHRWQDRQLWQLQWEFGAEAEHAAHRVLQHRQETETFFRFYTDLNNSPASAEQEAGWLTDQQRREVADFENFMEHMNLEYGDCLDVSY